MNESKVTYLLGAGASCNALPLVSNFIERLDIFKREIIGEVKKNTSTQNRFYLAYNKTISTFDVELENDLRNLVSELANHQSIDTFAKKLSSQKQSKKLDLLKSLLTIFFLYIQFSEKPDIRYDSFIAALINSNDSSFPKSVRVLNWNYDCQFELALCNFLSINDLNLAQDLLKIVPHVVALNKIEEFMVFKLNGAATLVDNNGKLLNIFDGFLESTKEKNNLIEKLITYYVQNKNSELKYSSGIKYAWENEPPGRFVINSAIENTADTNVLVVIGYSFPFFNRNIDQQVIRSMKSLSKVYIQTPPEFSNNVLQSFKSIGSSAIVESITETTQFFLPPELSL